MSATDAAADAHHEGSARAGGRWTPSPYALLRLAGKPYEELNRLKFPRTVESFGQILDLRARVREDKETVLRLLFERAGRYTGASRAKLVALKRTLYKERLPAAKDMRVLRAECEQPLRLAVLRFCLALRRLRRATRRGRVVFSEELTQARRLLRESCADEEFQKAIQVASPSLFGCLRDYLAADPSGLRARERKTELGLFQYLARMTAKTSPFGRFGPVARGHADVRHQSCFTAQPAPLSRRTAASLDIGAVSCVAASLARSPDLSRLPPLRVNAALYAEGDELVFWKPRSLWDERLTFEKGVVRRVKQLPDIMHVLDTLTGLQHQGTTLPEFTSLYQSLRGARTPEGRRQVSLFIRRMVEAGLFVNECELPSNSLDRLAPLCDRLAGEDAARVGGLLAQVRALRSSARRFGESCVSARQEILEETQRLLAGLTAWRPPREWETSSVASPFKEDTVLGGPGFLLGGHFFAPFIDDLSSVLDCVIARDGGGRNYALLRDIFTQRYGSGGVCDNLLRFAAEYAADSLRWARRGEEHYDSPLTPRLGLVYRRIRRYAEVFTADIERAGGTPEAAVARKTLDELCREFGGPAAGPSSTALHIQLAAGAEGDLERGDFLAVLNYTLPGFGNFFSRYCTPSVPADASDATPLHEQIRTRCAELSRRLHGGDGELVEVLSVLDHNAHVHPPFTRRHIVPPDEISERPADCQLDVRRLSISHDPGTDQLRLFERTAEDAGGALLRVTPLYMSFFHLMSLPPLHRLLASLSPTGHHIEMLRPAECQTQRAGGRTPDACARPRVYHSPRICVGRLVLQRESWQVPAPCPPEREGAADDFRLFLNVYAWAREIGLPPEVFVKLQGARKSPPDLRAGHKPLPVDFDNFFSIRLLTHLLRAGEVEELHVEEMLPNPRQMFFKSGGESYAAEFQLEFNRGLTL
jgi:hypothetical protein